MRTLLARASLVVAQYVSFCLSLLMAFSKRIAGEICCPISKPRYQVVLPRPSHRRFSSISQVNGLGSCDTYVARDLS
uniref:Uncharacterized protein n=1 Tax=Physcomitrium patens TaxID=3218 RepID=A0A2K1KBG0_PHYPA|nr:hypothetical protein PHYPA_010303 [Physcomitrium patens]